MVTVYSYGHCWPFQISDEGGNDYSGTTGVGQTAAVNQNSDRCFTVFNNTLSTVSINNGGVICHWTSSADL